jgi:hypothetical protein
MRLRAAVKLDLVTELGDLGGQAVPRGTPPLSGTSVLSASRLEPLVPLPLASPATFSHSVQEPGRASRCRHAGCRSLGIRTSTELIPEEASAPGACRDHRPDFSATFTTIVFDLSSSRWFGISDLIAEPEGPSFIFRTVTQPPCRPALVVTPDPIAKGDRWLKATRLLPAVYLCNRAITVLGAQRLYDEINKLP